MFENLDNYLNGLAIGVRFKKNFSIQDHYGSIADEILYSENSLFNPTVFPKLTTPPSEQLIFINEEINDKLVFDKANAILEINFSENSTFGKDNLPELINAFENKVIKGILRDLSITRIVRVGYIRKYRFEDDKLIKSLIDRVIGDDPKKIKDINFKFSRGIPLGESTALRDKNDYKHVIYNIIKNTDQENELFVTIDYQRFYVPNLATSTQIKFEQFIADANSYNSSDFLKWIKSFYPEGEYE